MVLVMRRLTGTVVLKQVQEVEGTVQTVRNEPPEDTVYSKTQQVRGYKRIFQSVEK